MRGMLRTRRLVVLAVAVASFAASCSSDAAEPSTALTSNSGFEYPNYEHRWSASEHDAAYRKCLSDANIEAQYDTSCRCLYDSVQYYFEDRADFQRVQQRVYSASELGPDDDRWQRWIRECPVDFPRPDYP